MHTDALTRAGHSYSMPSVIGLLSSAAKAPPLSSPPTTAPIGPATRKPATAPPSPTPIELATTVRWFDGYSIRTGATEGFGGGFTVAAGFHPFGWLGVAVLRTGVASGLFGVLTTGK